MVEPTTFTMPTTVEPAPFATRSASSVSAVSPDCEIAIVSVPGTRSSRRYRNSEAYSTETGMPASSSMT